MFQMDIFLLMISEHHHCGVIKFCHREHWVEVSEFKGEAALADETSIPSEHINQLEEAGEFCEVFWIKIWRWLTNKNC